MKRGLKVAVTGFVTVNCAYDAGITPMKRGLKGIPSVSIPCRPTSDAGITPMKRGLKAAGRGGLGFAIAMQGLPR